MNERLPTFVFWFFFLGIKLARIDSVSSLIFSSSTFLTIFTKVSLFFLFFLVTSDFWEPEALGSLSSRGFEGMGVDGLGSSWVG